jgi:CxxC-x17-CxxC domain-containing protein
MSTATDFEDINIICVDCGEFFVWAAGAQAFFADKGLLNQPKRCHPCKQLKTQRLRDIELVKSGVQKIEVQVTCAQCGAETTVPFYPSHGRPVYCRSCFLARQEDKEHMENVL